MLPEGVLILGTPSSNRLAEFVEVAEHGQSYKVALIALIC